MEGSVGCCERHSLPQGLNLLLQKEGGVFTEFFPHGHNLPPAVFIIRATSNARIHWLFQVLSGIEVFLSEASYMIQTR